MRYISSRAKLSVSLRRTVFGTVGALSISLYFPVALAQTTTSDSTRPRAPLLPRLV